MKVLIAYPSPGHSAVHLKRDEEQLYWDPGGRYGTEMDHCLETRNELSRPYCQRFAGFPWQELKATRRHDVVSGAMADLVRVLSIYHLDGDSTIEIFTFRLNGELGERAWRLIKSGAELGSKAEFKTDRLATTCTKAVSAYLRELGGPFSGIRKPWFPNVLAKEMERVGAMTSNVYTLRSPEVLAYIVEVRRQAELDPLPIR